MSSGSIFSAARYSASASANFPCCFSKRPRLLWALAKSGLSFSAARYSASASANFPCNIR